uniref:Ig-like domain-containing protein n=1 Tax=Coturnix japonica TaxID=93934 RepID=A0A8C2U458_COTJA
EAAVSGVSPSEDREKSVSISYDMFREPSQEEEVESRAENTQSCSFEFQVAEAPPTFLRLISDYSTFVGASACFQCLVTGSPQPSVQWYKDGKLLEGDRYYMREEEGGSHSLTIENLMQSMQDEGKYTCTASNMYGEAMCSAHLCVQQRTQGGEGVPSSLKTVHILTLT